MLPTKVITSSTAASAGSPIPPSQIEKVKAELLKIGPMRPGSLSEQYSACQKPGCKCVDPVHPQKHGPFYQLSYSHVGKSTTQFVRPQFVPEVRQQLANYKKFKALTQQWVTRHGFCGEDGGLATGTV